MVPGRRFPLVAPMAARRMFQAMCCVAAFAAATDALAQFGGSGGMGGGRQRGRGQQPQQEQRQPVSTPETGVNMLEQTIEELRIDLKLQPLQVPAWEAYVNKARLLASDIMRDRAMTTAVTQTSALKLIDRSVDAARNRLAALEEVADAAKALYVLLTPEQQAVADPRLAAVVPGRAGTYQPAPPRGGAPAPRPAGTGY